MDRRSKILDGIDFRTKSGLEVGALAWPTVTRSEGDVHFVDFMDAAGLRAKYADDPHVDVSQIVEVDTIWSGHPGLRGFVDDRRFDYVIASHVVEHVPDLVTWLTELSSVLTPRGEIRLVVPDRRFTFDYLRHETTLADVIDAWLQKRRVPSPRAIVDMIVNFVDLDRRVAWSDTPPAVTRRPIEDAHMVVDMARAAVERGVYHDVHSWVFTPKSFGSVMQDLVRLGLLQLECTCFHDTGEGEFEFFVGLRKADDRDAAAASWQAMASRAAAAPWEQPREPPAPAVPDHAAHEALLAELTATRDEVAALRASTSWQVTAPLRRMKTLLGRGQPGGDEAALPNPPPASAAAVPAQPPPVARPVAVASEPPVAVAVEPPASAASTPTRTAPGRVTGTLVKAPGSRFADRVFLCRRGRRHWITDARWLEENGYRWPEDVSETSADLLESFLPGRLAPRRWSAQDWANPPADSTMAMRELLVSRLRGAGYEIGAGTSPLPIPLDCEVRYIDMYDASGLVAQMYDGQQELDLIPLDIQASFDDLSVLEPQSADFFASCHVIEHTTSPMRSIFDAYGKLRPGGQIVLVVPEMTRTFDKDRALTTLDHLIEDFHHPDHGRDALHFQEFYSKAFVTPEASFEQVWREKWQQRYPIHYHTWTHASFAEMVSYMSANLCRFENVWSHPVLAHGESNEFYFVMTKPG